MIYVRLGVLVWWGVGVGGGIVFTGKLLAWNVGLIAEEMLSWCVFFYLLVYFKVLFL